MIGWLYKDPFIRHINLNLDWVCALFFYGGEKWEIKTGNSLVFYLEARSHVRIVSLEVWDYEGGLRYKKALHLCGNS